MTKQMAHKIADRVEHTPGFRMLSVALNVLTGEYTVLIAAGLKAVIITTPEEWQEIATAYAELTAR